MKSNEFKTINGMQLIEMAEDYQGYEYGVYADVIVDGITVRVDARFDNVDIVDCLKELGYEAEDDEALLDLYGLHDDEVDAYFFDQALEDQRDDLLREVEDAIEEKKNEIAEEIIENIGWDGMELIVYSDGYSTIRQEGSFGEDEDQIIAKVPLSEWYWSDTIASWVGDSSEIENLPLANRQDFIDDVILPILEDY
jgi:hypothetical protein